MPYNYAEKNVRKAVKESTAVDSRHIDEPGGAPSSRDATGLRALLEYYRKETTLVRKTVQSVSDEWWSLLAEIEFRVKDIHTRKADLVPSRDLWQDAQEVLRGIWTAHQLWLEWLDKSRSFSPEAVDEYLAEAYGHMHLALNAFQSWVRRADPEPYDALTHQNCNSR
jgi:hypothetical protein